ncbi:ABC transporter permease subunit [Phytohabitans rumicis]|uniref:ABC transporter permease n=1 Tax=Phytohabitans rumicis TaxID=1076125 RepID=A0A6V8LHQ8_9ACTN|nr:ABC transporter permease subunit [Phytohabitans rumicis]GFJ92185.1 ABC transporter permease [Phytohabitans rumicis]
MSALQVTQARVFRSEWIKFRSLRSTVLTLASAVVAVIGIGLVVSAVIGDGADLGGPDGGPDSTGASLAGVQLGQLLVGSLGVLVISGEYATGMIRSSLAAVPARLPVLWGKAVVFAAVTLAVMLPASFVVFLAGQALLGDAGVSLSDPGVLRAVIGAAVYLTGVGLFGMAVGALMRNTAAAITTVVGVMFVSQGIVNLLLPDSWEKYILPYMPSTAGESFMTVAPGSDVLSPWAGLAVFAGYLVVLLGAAAYALRHRDA